MSSKDTSSPDKPSERSHAVADFAAGCFWHVEEAFRLLDGVIDTEVGYEGGHKENPTYEEVCSHTTGHAETVRVHYDPRRISYEQLLAVFWSIHDPTQLNRQGPDIGDNYRSAIFYHDDAQREAAEKSKKALEEEGRYSRPIVTQIVPASKFWRAEEYHQKYFARRGIRARHC